MHPNGIRVHTHSCVTQIYAIYYFSHFCPKDINILKDEES